VGVRFQSSWVSIATEMWESGWFELAQDREKFHV
jgi:hypothetical protein